MARQRKKLTRNYLRLFVVECPGPIDALEARSESSGVAALAKLIGHAVLAMPVHSFSGFKEACEYIGSMTMLADADLSKPLCLHVSAHGADDGLLFGGKSVSWKKMLEAIQPILSIEHEGPRVLVLSSCEADQQKLTKQITEAVKKKKDLVPPKYLFCATGKVSWRDVAIGWALLYHLIPNVDLDQKDRVKEMLAKIESVDAAPFTYFRWNDETKTYRRHPAAS